MSVTSPLTALLKSNFRSWVSAKGFWLVVAAALLPVVLTGAWVGAHRADVSVSELRFDENALVEGQSVNFSATITNVGKTAVGAFNSTLVVGEVDGVSLFPLGSAPLTIDALQPGESRDISLTWNATPGIRYALVRVDLDADVGERDEYNNEHGRPIAVRRGTPDATAAPQAPPALAGAQDNATGTAALSVKLVRDASGFKPGDNATFRMEITNGGPDRVENAEAVVRISRTFANRAISVVETRENVTLDAGASQTISVDWTAQDGAYWHEGWIAAPDTMQDPDAADNHKAEAVLVDVTIPEGFTPPELPEKLTIKEFYLDVLSLLHLRLLLPLIALFYAAGVVADERERGTLLYLLTRPVPRWLIPLTKFVASFLVAAVATLVGLALTYLLLFGTTIEGGDLGFLTTPLLASLLTLFAYGAFFTFLGTLVARPYLVGLGLVLGWETLVNAAAGYFIPFMRNLTLSFHIGNTLTGDAADTTDGWLLDQGLQWLPTGAAAMRALLVVLVAGIACLVAASMNMRRREFEV